MSRGRPALPGSWQSSHEATVNSDSRRSRACPRPHVRSYGRVSPWSTSFPEILLPVHKHEAAGEEGISCDIQGPEEHSFSLRKSPCGPPPSFSLTSQRQSFLGMRRTCRLVSLLKKKAAPCSWRPNVAWHSLILFAALSLFLASVCS